MLLTAICYHNDGSGSKLRNNSEHLNEKTGSLIPELPRDIYNYLCVFPPFHLRLDYCSSGDESHSHCGARNPGTVGLIRKLLSHVLGDVPSRRDPDSILLCDVLHEVPQGFRSAGFPNNASVKRNIHHLSSFPIKAVKCILQVLFVRLGHRGSEAGGHMKFAIIAVVVIGYEQHALLLIVGKVLLLGHIDPVRYVVVIYLLKVSYDAFFLSPGKI